MNVKFFIIYLTAISCLETFAQDDIINGYKKFFYPNGSIQSEGLIYNGKPEGFWINYYPTGVKKSEGKRKNYLLDSTWVFYDINGDTIQKIEYLNGLKNGYSTEFIKNTADNRVYIKSRELFINNKKEGISQYYNDKGKLERLVSYENDLEEGISYEFADDNRIVTIDKYRKGVIIEREKINRYDNNNQKTGLWRYYFDDGKIKKEEYYKNGLLNGYYKEYDNSGTLKITLLYENGILLSNISNSQLNVREFIDTYEDGKIKQTGSYVNDKPVGIHKKYSRNGEIEIALIYNDNHELIASGKVDSNGRRQGIWKEFYTSGDVFSRGTYKNNLKDGKWDYYFENGKTEQTGTYTNGKINGIWKWYYPDGKLWKEENFLNGREDGYYVEYNQNGEILVEGEYIDGEKDGDWKTIINDNRAFGKYVQGLMDSKWRYYYDDGQLLFEGNFIQGNPDGRHRYYYNSGILKEEQYYNKGSKHKNWKKYNENGELIITITYKNDKEYRINGVKVDLESKSPTVIN